MFYIHSYFKDIWTSKKTMCPSKQSNMEDDLQQKLNLAKYVSIYVTVNDSWMELPHT